jgi:hypothetical protein
MGVNFVSVWISVIRTQICVPEVIAYFFFDQYLVKVKHKVNKTLLKVQRSADFSGPLTHEMN